jgi:hypothetical protein
LQSGFSGDLNLFAEDLLNSRSLQDSYFRIKKIGPKMVKKLNEKLNFLGEKFSFRVALFSRWVSQKVNLVHKCTLSQKR